MSGVKTCETFRVDVKYDNIRLKSCLNIITWALGKKDPFALVSIV